MALMPGRAIRRLKQRAREIARCTGDKEWNRQYRLDRLRDVRECAIVIKSWARRKHLVREYALARALIAYSQNEIRRLSRLLNL